MEIRHAEINDAEMILNYLNIVGGQTDNLLFGAEGLEITVSEEETIIAAIQQSLKSCMLIAVDEDKVIGIGNILENRRKRISHHVRLAISVDKSYWGKGVSQSLMNGLISFAKEKHVEIISLEVFEDNIRARKLYEKYGFEEIGYFKNYAKINGKYKHAVLMNLYLYKDEN